MNEKLTKAGKPRKRKPRPKEGRPEITFTDKQWDEFDKLCSLQCTKVEICEWFKITDKTLDRLIADKYKTSFSDIFAQKRSVGKISLRRTQFEMAQTSPAMAIFLGKNYLAQADKQEIAHSGGVKIIKDDIV